MAPRKPSSARPADPPTEWDVTVPGQLQRLSTKRKNARWKLVSQTPARFQSQPGEVYRLFTAEDTSDTELAGLERLAGLASLHELICLSSASLTDAGLAHVSSLTSLRALELTLCERITDAGLSHL